MKRHTKQSTKQKYGAFHTENVDQLFSGFESLVKNKLIIDPFVGGGDLIDWALQHGAKDYEVYDLFPAFPKTLQNDSLFNPPDYTGKFLVTNPPYLSRNKSKKENVKTFDKWEQDDLYKCHLASLYPTCDAGLIILPTNFLSESRPNARYMFFKNYTIGKAKYYMYQAFPNVTTGIMVFNFYKNNDQIKKFDIEIHRSATDIQTVKVKLSPQYNYLWGDEFFDYIEDTDPIKIIKYDIASKKKPNTKIVIGLLTKGSYGLGAHINTGNPLLVRKTTFTTYQISIDGYNLSNQQQTKIVDLYNKKLNYYIKKYHGLFLANYMGAEQKIKSRKFSNLLLSRVIKEILNEKPSSLEQFFK